MHKPLNHLYHAPTRYHARPKVEACRCRPQADWRRNALAGILWLGVFAAICALLAFAAGGCQHSATDLQIAQAQANATLKAAQVTAQNKVDVAKAAAHGKLADAAPVSHPVAATNQTIRHLRASLETVSVIAGVLFALFVGLLFTPLSWLSKFGLPLSGATAAVTLVDAIALPYVPWLLAAAGAGALIVIVYECLRHRSLKAGLHSAIVDVEAEIYGLSAPATAPAAPSVLSPQPSAPSSIEAAARNELATAVTKLKSLLGLATTAPALALAGSKAAPILVTSSPPVPAP